MGNAAGGVRGSKVIEYGEELQIFKSSQSRIEAGIGTAVKTQLPQNTSGLALHVSATHPCAAPCGKEQRGDNPQQRRFSRTVRPYQRHHFTGLYAEGNSTQRGGGSLGERMEECAPAADCREKFLEFFDSQSFRGHQRRYIGVAEREQARFIAIGALFHTLTGKIPPAHDRWVWCASRASARFGAAATRTFQELARSATASLVHLSRTSDEWDRRSAWRSSVSQDRSD